MTYEVPASIPQQKDPSSPRNRERRRLKIYAAVLMAFIVLFALIRSEEVIFVFLLYISIICEAMMLIILVSVSEAKGSGEEFLYPEDREIESRRYEGNSIIESLNVYVKYAARGSEFSRKEIALILRKLLSERNEIGDDSLTNVPEINRDLRMIVFPYLDERSYLNRSGNPSREYADALAMKGDAYLDSLGRIVSKLKTSVLS